MISSEPLSSRPSLQSSKIYLENQWAIFELSKTHRCTIQLPTPKHLDADLWLPRWLWKYSVNYEQFNQYTNPYHDIKWKILITINSYFSIHLWLIKNLQLLNLSLYLSPDIEYNNSKFFKTIKARINPVRQYNNWSNIRIIQYLCNQRIKLWFSLYEN